MIEEGLHVFGRAMSIAEQMCEDSALGERNDYMYGSRMGMRDDFDPMDEEMGARGGYSRYGGMGMRRGRSSVTGRYTRY